MAGSEVTLTIAGDASSATRALGQAEEALEEVGQAARQVNQSIGSAEDAFASAARSSGQLGEALDRTSGGFSMLSGGIGDVGGALTAFTDLQGAAEAKAMEMEAASIAAEEAQTAYNEAVAKYGENSLEARKAALDLKAAQAAAEPPTKIEEWGEKLELLSPIIMGVVGATDLLILANTMLSASWLRTAATATVSRIATVAGTVATGVATAAQWLWNIALTANPIGLIILAVVALVGVIVLIATKTTWFQTIWQAVWGAITAYFEFAVNAWKTVFETVWNAILAYFDFVVGMYKKAFDLIIGAAEAWWQSAVAAKDFVVDAFNSVVGFVTGLPARLRKAAAGMWDGVKDSFREAMNWIIGKWNALEFKLPGGAAASLAFGPLAGATLRTPDIPKFHSGGVVPGAPGSEMLAILQAGETVTPAGQSAGGRTVIELRSDGTAFGEALVEILSGAIRRGGGVDVVFGGRSG